MNRILTWIAGILFSVHGLAVAQQQGISIIPAPKSVSLGSGYFELSAGTPIIAVTEDARKSAALFNQFLFARQGITLKTSQLALPGKVIVLDGPRGEELRRISPRPTSCPVKRIGRIECVLQNT